MAPKTAPNIPPINPKTAPNTPARIPKTPPHIPIAIGKKIIAANKMTMVANAFDIQQVFISYAINKFNSSFTLCFIYCRNEVFIFQ